LASQPRHSDGGFTDAATTRQQPDTAARQSGRQRRTRPRRELGNARLRLRAGHYHFIRRWHRFGGGSARDIFEEFGLGEHEFFTETIELLGSTGASGVSEETAIRIRKVCRWRLSVRSHTPA
jgi:hypothetical protein